MIPETAVAFWLCVCVSVEAKVRRLQCWKVNWNMRGDNLWRQYLSQERLFSAENWNLSSWLGRCSQRKCGAMCVQHYCQGQSSWRRKMLYLSACMQVSDSFASPCKLYLRSLLQWGNDNLFKSTAQRAGGTQTMRWKHVSDTVIALLV